MATKSDELLAHTRNGYTFCYRQGEGIVAVDNMRPGTSVVTFRPEQTLAVRGMMIDVGALLEQIGKQLQLLQLASDTINKMQSENEAMAARLASKPG